MKYKISVYNSKNELLGEREPKFMPEQLVWIVEQKRKKIIIYKARVNYVSLTDCYDDLTYIYRYHIYNTRKIYWDDTPNIFANKEEAYEYAELLDKRRNIKIKDFSEMW